MPGMLFRASNDSKEFLPGIYLSKILIKNNLFLKYQTI